MQQRFSFVLLVSSQPREKRDTLSRKRQGEGQAWHKMTAVLRMANRGGYRRQGPGKVRMKRDPEKESRQRQKWWSARPYHHHQPSAPPGHASHEGTKSVNTCLTKKKALLEQEVAHHYQAKARVPVPLSHAQTPWSSAQKWNPYEDIGREE